VLRVFAASCSRRGAKGRNDRRLSRAGVFEAFFEALAALSGTAHLVQMFDSTIVRAHVSAAGAKGGRVGRRWAAPGVGSRPKSTSRPTGMAIRWAFA
jgi:transposase